MAALCTSVGALKLMSAATQHSLSQHITACQRELCQTFPLCSVFPHMCSTSAHAQHHWVTDLPGGWSMKVPALGFRKMTLHRQRDRSRCGA